LQFTKWSSYEKKVLAGTLAAAIAAAAAESGFSCESTVKLGNVVEAEPPPGSDISALDSARS
jgi:hypothetical protein